MSLSQVPGVKNAFKSVLSEDEHLILFHRLLFKGDAGEKSQRRKDVLAYKGLKDDELVTTEENMNKSFTVVQIKAVMKYLALPFPAAGVKKEGLVSQVVAFLNSFPESIIDPNSTSDTSAHNEGSASASSSKKRHADESSSGETPRTKRKTLFTTATADVLVTVFPHLSTKPVTLKNLSKDLWATLPKAQKASGWLPQAMHAAAAHSVTAHSVAQPDEALALFSNFTFGKQSTVSITETAAL
jgi:hypothetical protein